MSDGGKGSKPRPFSVARQEFEKNWNNIFNKKVEDNTGVTKNEYYDELSTEDCFPEDFEDWED